VVGGRVGAIMPQTSGRSQSGGGPQLLALLPRSETKPTMVRTPPMVMPTLIGCEHDVWNVVD